MEAPAERISGSETVLLVDDNASVRAAIAAYLEMRGYNVLQAADGEAGLEVSSHHAVDVLVTDVVMPRMSGHELAMRLIAQQPQLKVLYMSGYTEEAIFQHGLSHFQSCFLQKPVPAELLVRKIRELLDTQSFPTG
jgi:hypothetical protein